MTAPRTRLLLTLLAPLLVVLASCSGSGTAHPAQGTKVRIVGQNFTEADVVSHLYAALLDQAGFHATVTPMGGRDIYLSKLRHGDVQVAGDLLSSTTEAINQKVNGDSAVPVSSSDVRRTLGQLTRLGSAYGVRPLEPSRAQLTTAYAVTETFAKRYHLASLSDLGRLHRPLALAASTDCDQRLDCADGLESVYGLTLSRVVPLGSGTPDSKAALIAGRVQLAQVATTDTQVDTDGLVLLDDDQHIQKAENITPLVNARWLAKHETAKAALDRLSGVLTTADLRQLSAQVNRSHAKPADVAQSYLERKGLLTG